jgi:Fic family protein
MGLRKKAGFVNTTELQEHLFQIIFRQQHIEPLMNGLLAANAIMQDPTYDVLAAAAIVGFVFIHPFVDGNGRLHRYIIHHVLAKKNSQNKALFFRHLF